MEKILKGGKHSTEKEIAMSQGQHGSVQQMRSSVNVNEQMGRSETGEGINSSFHIRKKKTVQMKEKEKEDISRFEDPIVHIKE